MKKLYRIVLLLIALIFLSTYNPNKFDLTKEKNNPFFKIKNITILNTSLVEKHEIDQKLREIYNKNIFFIKRSDIEVPLKNIDFLEKIEVKKKYPNTVIVKIYETKPIAIIFKKKNKYFLDSSSNLVTFRENTNFDELPGVFGKEAEHNFVYFFQRLKNNNFPRKQVKNFYYFQVGRWDLQLTNNQIIKLPYNKTDEAIIKSVELLNRKDFKNYNIIDLRVPGKIIVE